MSVGAATRAIGVALGRADLGLGGRVCRGLAAVCGLCIGVRGAAVEALILLGLRRLLRRGLGGGFDGYLALRPGQIAGAQRLVLALHQVVLSWLALLGCHALVATQELVEERTEVDHRLAQVLGAGVALRGANGDAVRGAVVLDDHGMVDRHVCSALLEVLGDGVAALAHDLRDERVGLGHRGRRLIDEGPLRRGPALGVALARRGFQFADLELRASVATLGQFGLRFTAVPAIGEDASVFGTEILLQLLRSPAAHEQHGEHDHDDHEDRHDDPGHDGLPFRRRVEETRTGTYPHSRHA